MLMTPLIVLNLLAVVLCLVVALRQSVERRVRLVAGVVAAVALLFVIFGRSWLGDDLSNRLETANRRQGFALGFGLGEHLKQTQASRRVVILRGEQETARDRETMKGLQDGVDGALKFVGERHLDQSQAVNNQTLSALFTTELLKELRATGADIVVSFVGLPMRVKETGEIDTSGTFALWQSEEYRALQWVLASPPALVPPRMFQEGRVLAAVREKQQDAPTGDFPAFLDIKGTPAELFNAWFELVTTE